MSGTFGRRENLPGPSQSRRKDDGEMRKYAKISTESIKMMSEAAGMLGFTDEMANHLSDDVTYRLREVLHHASIFLRHSRRKKLLPKDIHEVLEDYNVPLIFLQSATKTVDFVHVEEPGVSVWKAEEEDLVVQAFESKELFQLGDPVIKDSKIAPELQEAAQSEPQPQPVIKQEEIVPCISIVDEPPMINLPPHLLKYYEHVMSVILGRSKIHYEIVTADLLINYKIGPIIPFVLNTLSMSMQKIPRKRAQALHAVLVLTFNRSIEFSSSICVNRLVSALLLCALAIKVDESVRFEDDFHVKRLAALVLSRVVSEWCRESKLQLDIMQKLGAVLLNGSSPLRSHYGALVCLVSLGSEALEYCLWPNLAQYLSFLEANSSEREVKEIEGAILDAAEDLYRLEWIRMLDPSTLPQGILVVDRLLEAYFGDTLCSRWAHSTKDVDEHLGNTEEAGPSCMKASSSELGGSFTLPAYKDWTNRRKPRQFPWFSQNKGSSVIKYKMIPGSTPTKRYNLSDVFDLTETYAYKLESNAIEMNFAGGKPVSQEDLVIHRLDMNHRQFTVASSYFENSCEAVCTGQAPGMSLAQPKSWAYPTNVDIFMVL